MKIFNQKGDTIIEVLIAIAVLSVVLGGAYAIANRSLTSIRQAQEHTEALKLAESQSERLKQLADTGGRDGASKNIYVEPPFCINITPLNGLKIDVPSSCVTGRYTQTITRSPVAGVSPPNTVYKFEVKITWQGIRGGNDKVSLSYRLDR